MVNENKQKMLCTVQLVIIEGFLFLDILKRSFYSKINSTSSCSSKINSHSESNDPTFSDLLMYSSNFNSVLLMIMGKLYHYCAND